MVRFGFSGPAGGIYGFLAGVGVFFFFVKRTSGAFGVISPASPPTNRCGDFDLLLAGAEAVIFGRVLAGQDTILHEQATDRLIVYEMNILAIGGCRILSLKPLFAALTGIDAGLEWQAGSVVFAGGGRGNCGG